MNPQIEAFRNPPMNFAIMGEGRLGSQDPTSVSGLLRKGGWDSMNWTRLSMGLLHGTGTGTRARRILQNDVIF